MRHIRGAVWLFRASFDMLVSGAAETKVIGATFYACGWLFLGISCLFVALIPLYLIQSVSIVPLLNGAAAALVIGAYARWFGRKALQRRKEWEDGNTGPRTW